MVMIMWRDSFYIYPHVDVIINNNTTTRNCWINVMEFL